MKKRRAIKQESETRQVGPMGKIGRGVQWQSIGALAGKLMRDVNRKR